MIPPEFDSLLEPLERFEAIRHRVVRLGPRLCDLSYANPYSGAQEAAVTAIRDALQDRRRLDLQYSPFGGQTLGRRAVADALRLSHGLPFRFDDVILTPGAMAALHIILHSCARPGGEVVIPVPCWLDYPLYARACGLRAVEVPLASETFDLDIGAIAEALTERTCAVLLSHPANPTGRSYRGDALRELAKALGTAEAEQGSEVTLIADEAHRDFTEPGDYRTAAAYWPRTVIVYSFGKYHFLQGQRLGYAAVSPRHPTRAVTGRELARWTRILGAATPTSLMQRALPRLLELRHPQDWLTRWRRRIVDELSASGYRPVVPEATLFVYVRTPPRWDDFEFVEDLAGRGLLVLPAPVFHHRGYFRLSLSGTDAMMEQALRILEHQP